MSDSRPFAITLGVGSSLANKTGAWRTERPVYVDRMRSPSGTVKLTVATCFGGVVTIVRICSRVDPTGIL